MGRPRKWESDAERKRVERGSVEAGASTATSEAGPAEGLVPDPPRSDGPDLGVVEFNGTLLPVVRQAHVSEDDFAYAEVLATKHMISRGLKDHDGERLARAERYARYRYRGWLAGEIASL